MILQWCMRRSGLEGSRWDVFQKYFKKILSWDLFKEASDLYNNNLNKSSGWFFSKDQNYTMPMFNNDEQRLDKQNERETSTFPNIIHDNKTSNILSTQYEIQDENRDIKKLERGIVNASYLHFRKKPGGEHINYLHHDTPVEIIETFDKWLRVSVDGQEGFVFRKYIILENELEREAQLESIDELSSELENFNGDLDWILKWEGHNGKPYWPQGISGITLDPGVDLGHSDHISLIKKYYDQALSQEQMVEVEEVAKKRLQGTDARDYLLYYSSSTFRSIRITRSQSQKIFPHMIRPYWQKITKRFPMLTAPDAPKSVQTALLSMAYNRGPNNPKMKVLEKHIENKDWLQLADKIKTMQQNHILHGIRRRRRSEAKLILEEFV